MSRRGAHEWRAQAELLPAVLALGFLELRSEGQMTFAWTALLLSASEKWLPAQSSVLVFWRSPVSASCRGLLEWQRFLSGIWRP